jgi:hypothetical protein
MRKGKNFDELERLRKELRVKNRCLGTLLTDNATLSKMARELIEVKEQLYKAQQIIGMMYQAATTSKPQK